MRLAAATLLLLATVGCGKSVCETYADMEWKCGNYPTDEKEITLTLARAVCEAGAAPSSDEAREAFSIHARESECAKRHANDCTAYEACKSELREATRRAAR